MNILDRTLIEKVGQEHGWELAAPVENHTAVQPGRAPACFRHNLRYFVLL